MKNHSLKAVGLDNIGPRRLDQSGGLFDPRVQRRYLAQGKITVDRLKRVSAHWERLAKHILRRRLLDFQVIAANWEIFHNTIDEDGRIKNPL